MGLNRCNPDLEEQLEHAISVTAVVLTNSSRDAAGGLGNLDRWLESPTPLVATQALWDEIVPRYGPFSTLQHHRVEPYQASRVGDLLVTAVPVETGNGLTYAYQFDNGKKRVLYASDLKHIPEAARPFFRDNELLVVDAAGWDKDLPTHRGALNHLPDYLADNNQSILFTHIGRAAPPHALASSAVRRLSPRADVGYDTLKFPLGR